MLHDVHASLCADALHSLSMKRSYPPTSKQKQYRSHCDVCITVCGFTCHLQQQSRCKACYGAARAAALVHLMHTCVRSLLVSHGKLLKRWSAKPKQATQMWHGFDHSRQGVMAG